MSVETCERCLGLFLQPEVGLDRLFGLGSKANGRLLLSNIREHTESSGSTQAGRPRAWLASNGAMMAAAAAPSVSSVATSSAIAAALSSVDSIMADLHRMLQDPAFSKVPVPTVYLGKLMAPIPAGRPTLDAHALLEQLQRGVLPSDSLPEADREVWRAVSRITDPISAYNICQAQQLAGRKLILTERGVAEQLARGTIQMVPVQDGGRRTRRSGSLLASLNPFAPLQWLAGRLAEGQRLSKKVEQRAAALGQQPSSSGASNGPAMPTTTTQQQGGEGKGEPQPASNGAQAGAVAAGAGAAAGPPAPQQQPQQQYSLQDVPARRLLASGSPPQLAWVPLRVALQLLRSLPQHFMLLTDLPQQRQQQQQPHLGHQLQLHPPGGAQQGQPSAASGSTGDSRGGAFTAIHSPGAIEVHVIPGLHVRQVTPEGSSIEFTPAFISHDQAQALWRDVREISGGAMLMYRRLERSLMRRRLENAAALIAGSWAGSRGGQAGGGGGASAQDDDDDGAGGMEEPPEIQDFVRELGGALAQEAAAAGALPPPSGLPRVAATFACGVVSLAAQALSWAGNTADWLMMATPLGPRLLGIPEASIERHRLSDLLAGMQQYNREQAVVNARFGNPPVLPLLAALPAPPEAKQEQEQEQQEQHHKREQQKEQAGAAGGAATPSSSSSSKAPAAEPATATAAPAGGLSGSTPPAQDGAAGSTAPTVASSPSVATAATSAVPAEEEAGAAAAAAAAASQRYSEAAATYSRTLAAAAIWLALGTKNIAEEPGVGVGSGSLTRMLAKAFTAQGQGPSQALGQLGRRVQALPLTVEDAGQPSTASPAALAQATPGAPEAAASASSSMQEAVESVLAAGLPLLEHNGFQLLFTDPTSGISSSGRGGSSSRPGAHGSSSSGSSTAHAADQAAAAAASPASLAAHVAQHCTTDTHLGLGVYVKDGGSGSGFRMTGPLGPLPAGRGLVLVGDLDLERRQRGRTPGRTMARWLTVSVDDGRKLL